MVKVATNEANSPVSFYCNKRITFKFESLARKLNFQGKKDTLKLSLPGKLIIPSYQKGNFSILGLGDIVMPGKNIIFILQ